MKYVPYLSIALPAVILLAWLFGRPDAADRRTTDQVLPAQEVAVDHGVAPPNEYRRRLTREAMRGLLYDGETVAIDEETAADIVQRQSAEAAETAYQQGLALLRRNAILESIKAHTRAVLLAPHTAKYYEGLGAVLLAKRKSKEASVALRTAVDLDPDSVIARMKLADALHRLGDLQASMEERREVLARDPSHAAAHGRLAIDSYYTGQMNNALLHLHRAQALGFELPAQFLELIEGRSLAASVRSAPQIGGQRRINLGSGGSPGNETSIAASDFDPMNVVATWNDYREGSARTGVGLSFDGGETWEDFLLRPPAQYRSGTEGDPMTAYDSRTGTLWVGAISFGGNGGVFVARKNTGESSFQPVVMAEITGGADKGWMAAGADPNSNSTRMYIAYNEGLLISSDQGDTWSGPVSLGPGLGFLPRVGPNGELYIAYWDYSGSGDGVMLIRSLDGGATLSSPIRMATRMDVWGIDGSRFPGDYRVATLVHIAVDPNTGTLYCVYFDTTNVVGGNFNVDLYFTRSLDNGSSWTTPTVINSDANPPGDQFFPWIEVDQSGRLHMLFYDTRAVDQDDSDSQGMIEAYYSYSDDGGDSWVEAILTPAPFNSQFDGFGGGFIGDYLGLAVGGNRVYPCYMSTQDEAADVFGHTIVFGSPGDIDGDGDVDLDDYAVMADCLEGPGVTPNPTPPTTTQQCLDNFDFDGQDDVDLADFAVFTQIFTGT